MGRYDGRSSPEWFVAKEETPKAPSRDVPQAELGFLGVSPTCGGLPPEVKP